MGAEAIKKSMEQHQQEYRRIIALLGHSRAQRLGFQQDEEEYERQLVSIIKKIRNLESQMPKEAEGKDHVESSSSVSTGESNLVEENRSASAV